MSTKNKIWAFEDGDTSIVVSKPLSVKKKMLSVVYKWSEPLKKLRPNSWLKLVEHFLSLLYFALCDFALFPHEKIKMKRWRFSNDEDFLRALNNECCTIPNEICRFGLILENGEMNLKNKSCIIKLYEYLLYTH